MKTLLVIALASFATAASGQSMWPFQPYQERERPRTAEKCIDLPVLDSPALAIKTAPTVKQCFWVDPATNVPQPTPVQKPLRRI